MRTPSVFRLIFRLPPSLWLLARPGRHCPCLHGCVLSIDQCRIVEIEGPSRERVCDQAQRFMRVVSKDIAVPDAIPAWLTSPCGRRDGWSIIVRAEIAIVPTSMPAILYGPDEPEQAG